MFAMPKVISKPLCHLSRTFEMILILDTQVTGKLIADTTEGKVSRQLGVVLLDLSAPLNLSKRLHF